MTTRTLDAAAAASLPPGALHYRAFVGPPNRFDLISSNQFSLLTLLGMRETHRLLDFGCGSLRLGRLAIPYLRPGNYFGVEPEKWLVEDGLANELGESALIVKRPTFAYNSDYRTDQFGVKFDFINAQSIFSHTGENTTRQGPTSFKESLADDGVIVANWLLGSETEQFPPETSEWVYPECVPFSPERVDRLVREAGLVARICPWPHPGGLTYFLLAHSEDFLPSPEAMAPLAITPLSR